jgi:TPR repeat protein
MEKRTRMTSKRVRKITIGKGRVVVLFTRLAVLGLMFCLIFMPGFALAIEEDPSELFWALIEEARWGESEAQYAVAMMYAAGEGVEMDQVEAAKWFEKAAEEGHPYAMYKIAERYEKGDGVGRDPEKALEWYKKAAETGYAQGDDAAYYKQVRQLQVEAMKERYRQEQLEEDRKYEDQVRREQNRHQERVNKQRNRYYYDDYYYRRGRSGYR